MTGSRERWHVRSDADWSTVAPADPDAVMAAQLTDRFHAKQDRSIVRWPVGPGLTVYLKRHHCESPRRSWLAKLTGHPSWSNAWQEYRHLRWAANAGFRVPRPVAVGVRIGPGRTLAGFLAVEELTGMLALHELIPLAAAVLPPKTFHMWKRGLVRELARVVSRLHGCRHFHKDLYLCHFFAPASFAAAPPKCWTGQVAMIDLHRLSKHSWTAPWWRLKDLAQLLYSSEVAGVSARDRLRFWQFYAGRQNHEGWWPVLKQVILLRWRNYRGKAKRRQAA